MTIKGDPDRLAEYSSITLATLPPARSDAMAYGSIVNALNHAPSSLALAVSNLGAWIEGELTIVGNVDRRPAAFGFALRQLDHFVADMPRDRTYLYTNDLDLFDALVASRLAHPGDADADVYELALDSLTGTPGELAGRVGSVLGQINDSMDGDDVDAMKDRLKELLFSIQDSNIYRDPPLTDLEMVHQAWVVLHGAGDDDIVPAALVRQLETLTDLLGRRRFDPAFTTAFYQALGPDTTALLPRAISLSSWSDYQRTSGEPTFRIDDVLANVDSALALASPNLSTAWRDDLFDGAVRDGTLDDSFPLLFSYGHYSTEFSQAAGQLGLDVLHGTVVVDRGAGSPGYPNFDQVATNWEDRGTLLVAAAARTPDAANALLRDDENAGWLTGNKFGRDGRHPPDWNIIGPSIRDLIVSGTVYAAERDPSLARDATANVINASLDAGPGDASHALAPAYGQMVLQYLPDFARSPALTLNAANRDDHLSIGSMQAAQFTSLAMHDDGSRDAIFTMRDALDVQTVVLGLESDTDLHPPWAQRLANLDGIVLSGDNGEVFVTARQLDADARNYNENLDTFQTIAMGVVGLAKFPGSGLVDKAIDKGFDTLKDNVLSRDANNAEHAGYTTNLAEFSAFDHERLVVAEGHLIAAVRAQQSGSTLTKEQADTIAFAEQQLGTPYVDSLRNAANGVVSGPITVTPRQLQEWAGSTLLDDFTSVSNYTDLILPHDGTALWPH
ncbi:MAG: hypothetical protein QOI95_1082 [Acidimicrobiaceae bacterium]